MCITVSGMLWLSPALPWLNPNCARIRCFWRDWRVTNGTFRRLTTNSDRFLPIKKKKRPDCSGSLRFVTNTSDCHGPLQMIKTELGLIQHTPNSENELTMNRLYLLSDRKFGMMRFRLSPIADMITDVHPTCHQNFENKIGTLNPNFDHWTRDALISIFEKNFECTANIWILELAFWILGQNLKIKSFRGEEGDLREVSSSVSGNPIPGIGCPIVGGSGLGCNNGIGGSMKTL